jgi:cyclic pyranopterin phosphate synthase
MKDNFARNITYLRLSVTDLCNLRCIYCMPECGIRKFRHSDILSIEEIESIVRASAACGIEKVRLTGGEPLVRNGIIDICNRIASIDGIREICLTTNGTLLPKFAKKLYASGVRKLNISLDTFHPEKYKRLSRTGTLSDALDGLKAAQDTGFESIKINVVLMGGINDDEIGSFVELTRNNDLSVRFIELMPIGECAHWDKERFIDAGKVLRVIPQLKESGTNGVAKLYQVPGWRGSVGLITPISSHFCSRCNRIRVTSDGKLKPCLHSSAEINLKGLSGANLIETIRFAIRQKPMGHHLSAENSSDSLRNMNEIGG